MSVAAPPPKPKNAKSGDPSRIGSQELIESRIEEACRALWWAEIIRTVLRLVVFSIAAVLLWAVIDQWIYSPGVAGRVLAFLALLAAMGTYFYRKVRPLVGGAISPDYAARSLERDMPELRQSLTSYVTLSGDTDSGHLRGRVVRSIGSSTARHLKKHDALPHEATGTLRWWVATAVALVLLAAYAGFSPKNTLQSASRLLAPVASIEAPRRVSIKKVVPGNSEAIAGRSVEVSAEIIGLQDDSEAICFWELPSGRQEFVLEFDPAERRHVGRLELPHSSSGIVPYRIVAGDAEAGPFSLTVQDVPVVALDSVQYTPPKYTGQAPYTSSNGAITAVDGTVVRILASTNRAVAKAKIEFNPRKLGNRVQATAGVTAMKIDEQGTSLSVDFPVRSAHGRSAAVELESYRILVWDDADQGNPDPIVYPIRVVADLPPECTITVPASSPKDVPINAQQIIEVHASDPDFGLKSVALEIRAGIDVIDRPILWSSDASEKGHRVVEHRFRPSDHDLRIGDAVEVVAVATDNRSSEVIPNIEPNVVRTDPVVLKITPSGLLPDENDPSADGLSKPEEKPAQDEGSKEESGGESGEEQSGGGGSGSGSKQQEGGGEGEGGSSGSGEGEGSNENSGEGGSGEDNSSNDSEGDDNQGSSSSTGSDSEGDSEGNPDGGDPTGQGGQGDQPDGDQSDSSNDGDRGDDGSNSDDESGGESGGENGGQSGSQAGGEGKQNQGTGNDASGQSDDGSDRRESGQQSGENDQEGAGGNSGQDSGGQNSGSQDSGGQDSGGQDSGGQSGEGAGNQPKQAPKHDGEAFERIQEYMENQQQNSDRQESGGQGETADQNRDNGDQSGNGERGGERGSDNQASPQSDGSSGSNDQSSNERNGDPSQDGSSGQSGDNDSTQGSEQSSSSSGEDSTSSDAGSTGSGDQDQSAGSESTAGTGADQDQPQNASGDNRESETGGDDSRGDGASGESGAGEEQQNSGEGSDSESASNQRSGTNSDASQENQEDARPGSESDSSASSSEAGKPSDPQPGKEGESNTTASTSAGGSAGDGSDLGSESDEPPPPPDPANVEYAKKATDLVLDYLQQTRESPDPQLLEDLQWTKEDLQRFTDRWQKVRDMPNQGGLDGNRELEDALKSLGLRPKSDASNTTREAGDALRNIRDSGNRKAPPAPFRDAFDAFRRSVGG